MNRYGTKHPVAFLVFNRPDCTREVFARIAAARPAKLYVVADGPREHVPADEPKCREVRRIVESVDWDCDLSLNFAASNLGCRTRVASGIDWVFGQTESAIILEDDCLPSPSFFRFCDELLDRYRDEPRVMMISGTNLLRESRSDRSYLFTMHGRVWGWATWRRAWSTYDVDLGSWPSKKLADPFHGLPFHRKEIGSLERTLDNLAEKDPAKRMLDTWDFQWDYNRYIHDGLAITPRVNLVSNIGFGSDATHTPEKEHKLANIPAGEVEFPLVHPQTIELSLAYEMEFRKKIVGRSFAERARKFFKRAGRSFSNASR